MLTANIIVGMGRWCVEYGRGFSLEYLGAVVASKITA